MFRRQVPVFWFAILLLLWVATSSVGYFQGSEHIRKMEAFMAQGDRFTGQDGREMAARIDQLERRIILLETNNGH